MPRLSILIAVLNEDAYIKRCLDNIVNEKLPKWTKEIIVVNDGSTDNTLSILKQYHRTTHPLTIIDLPVNMGKGHAIKTAAAAATGDVLLIQDADLEYDPNDYHAILKEFQKKTTMVVYGSRILGEKLYTNRPSNMLFYWGGKSLSGLINVLFHTRITDQPTCYKAWRASLTPALLQYCPSQGFEFEIEMTAFFAKHHHSIVEVPIHYYPRTKSYGKKIGFKDFVLSVAAAIRCFFQQ